MASSSNNLPKLDLKSLPGPETIERVELDNGIVAMARENFSSQSVVIMGTLPIGSILEKPEQAGLADLTVSALMRGTEKRTFHEIYDAIESIGASLGLGVGKHSTSFQGKALAEDLHVLLELLAEVLKSPIFPKSEVERLRAESLTSLAIRDQDTSAKASLAFYELAYQNHPYSIPGDGYKETVAGLKPADLKDFHRRYYGPQGMKICVVGGVPVGDAVEAVRAAFDGWQVDVAFEAPALDEPTAPDEVIRREIVLEGKSQSDLVVGVPGPSRFEPDYLPAVLGNNILGRFGLMGRIGDSVREEAGLAYYAYSVVAGGPGPGPWRVNAGVNPENIDLAIDLILDEIGRFSGELVSEEEIQDNQANFIGRLPLQLESNEGVAGSILHVERYGLGLDYYQRYPALIAAITREQILEQAARYLDSKRMAIGIAGPARNEK